jgi:aminopeptidase YwaD
MRVRITYFMCLSVFVLASLAGWANKKADKKAAERIKKDIYYFASEDLEGRRTSYAGEAKAATYIENRYKELGIPAYKGTYKHPFQFVYGKKIAPNSSFSVNNVKLQMNDDVFPMPFSNSKAIKSDVIRDIMEQGSIWMLPVYSDSAKAVDPHFEADKYMFNAARDAEKKGAGGVVFYDAFGAKFEPSFNSKSDYESIGIPVVFVKHAAYEKYLKPNADKNVSIEMDVAINKSERTGIDLAAIIDNKAKYTVVLGAHFDHLGYGEDGNSLYANADKEHKIHFGADDNASGTAALLEEALYIKQNPDKFKKYNYMFVNFSGEELGLFGSKAFVKDEKLDSNTIAYMLNMDMVGRLNDSTHSLTIGGIGTSPSWEEVVNMGRKNFKLIIDSAGIGPSDHTSFYNAGIPVLFFFTGTHKDYHKPTDKPEYINYPGEIQVLKYVDDVLLKMESEPGKPGYVVTKMSLSAGNSSFKVTLGIMPDYSFQDGGVRIDGVSDGRPASKAGLLGGDIIVQLGTIKIEGMHSYMDALSKFSPGEKTTVTIMRGGKKMEFPLEFASK